MLHVEEGTEGRQADLAPALLADCRNLQKIVARLHPVDAAEYRRVAGVTVTAAAPDAGMNRAIAPPVFAALAVVHCPSTLPPEPGR